jgi:hypothetical protein
VQVKARIINFSCKATTGSDLAGKKYKIKKGQDKNPAPFFNPISYEKPVQEYT